MKNQHEENALLRPFSPLRTTACGRSSAHLFASSFYLALKQVQTFPHRSLVGSQTGPHTGRARGDWRERQATPDWREAGLISNGTLTYTQDRLG